MRRFCYLLPVVAVLFLIAGCGKSETATETQSKPQVVQSMNIKPSGEAKTNSDVE
jgi:uncharacterized lipoprotein YajG